MHVQIKICGVTEPDDAVQTAEAGADAIGLNFFAQSPRYVDPARALSVLHALPPFVTPVGVFVNPIPEHVNEIVIKVCGLHTVQCHGLYAEMRDTDSYRLIPAFSARDAGSLDEIVHYLGEARSRGSLPAAILVDAHVPGQYGGTGQTAPWKLLADFHPGVPIILAGGLTPENVVEAISTVRPYAVDVASGVESSPGRKDPEKIRRFIANAREASVKLI